MSEPLTADELDGMTKDQLLAYGQELGITPMNAGMSKDEIRAGIDAYLAGEGVVGVEPQVTTTMTKDYMGVALVNATPGTSQATDRLGRSVVAGNKDFMGRSLVA